MVDVDPFRALFENTYLWHELIHMYVAGYVVTGFVLAGVYAFGRLRGRWGRYERTALAIPLTIAALASIVQGPVGDWAARDVATVTADQARGDRGACPGPRAARPSTSSAGTRNGQVKFGIEIPHLLSLLAFHSWNATVQGLGAVPADERPPVNVVRVAFQTMVGIGTLLALLGAGLPGRRGSGASGCPSRSGSTGRVVLAGPLSVVALIAGWVVTEVGRQPWVVYHVMPTDAGRHRARTGSPSATARWPRAYLVVGCGLAWVLRRLARAPLDLARRCRRASLEAA